MGITLEQLKNTVNKVMTKVVALNSTINSNVSTHTENEDIHVTAGDKTKWNAMLQDSKDYANGLLSEVNGFGVIVCDSELPVEDIKEKTFYFVPNNSEEDKNIYDEYIYVNNKWEIIGKGVNVDLTDYLKKSEIDTTLTDYAKTSALEGYETKEDLNSTLKQYAKTDAIVNYSNEDVNSAVDEVLGNF